MRSVPSSTLFIIAAILLLLSAKSHSTIQLSNTKSYQTIEHHSEFLIDHTAGHHYFELSHQAPHDLNGQPLTFQPPNGSTNFGFTDARVWLRFTVQLPADAAKTAPWYLVSNYPTIDELLVFAIEPEGQLTILFDNLPNSAFLLQPKYQETPSQADGPPQTASTHWPATQQGDISLIRSGKNITAQPPLDHRNIAIPLPLPVDQPITIVIAAKTDTSMQLPFELWDAHYFITRESHDAYGWGLYFGILIALFAYNAFLYISVQKRAYLFYISYLFSFAGITLFLNGQGQQFVWPDIPQYNAIALPVFTGISILSICLFTQHFLKTAHHMQSLHKLINVLSVLSMTLILGALLMPAGVVKWPFISGLMGSLLPFVMITAGIRGIQLRIATAPYFLTAWFFFLCGLITYLLLVFGLLESNILTRNAMQIGSALEAILLSLALAHSIKVEKAKRIDALDKQNKAITKWRNAEKKMLYKAQHDTLTTLPNRSMIIEACERLINSDSASPMKFAVLTLHLKRFHEVNKTLGKQNGDLLLVHAADRLNQITQTIEPLIELEQDKKLTHKIALMDGVTFSALIDLNSASCSPNEIASQLIQICQAPLEFQGMSISIDAKAGIARYPEHGCDVDTLLRHSDIAMESADLSEASFAIYEPNKDGYSTRRLTLMSDLSSAIDNEELELYLQPQMSVNDIRLTGAEALIRWKHHTHGFITPDEFIPLAEQSGLIKKLTRWVLNKALSYASELARIRQPLQISINLSAKNLQENDLIYTVEQQLKKYNYPSHKLTLEVTESSVMDNPDQALDTLHKLKALGLHLSIDDFGTGYSSLSYLRKMPVDELKIDRTFVMNMEQNTDDQKIVEMTINLSHTLGLSVVAEGIESEHAIQQLNQLGCDYIQGYHIARPMPFEEFKSWASKLSASLTVIN